MAIELQTFASGDTDYISKLNANMTTLTDAINALQQVAAAAGQGGVVSAGLFLDTLFNHTNGLIGPGSYKPTFSATTVTVAPGGMYLASTQTVVTSLNNVPLNFLGQTSGTYYVTVTGGTPTITSARVDGSIYSVPWSGSAFTGGATYLVPIFFDTLESDQSRKSTVLNRNYPTIDDRLEATETTAKNAAEDASSALSIAYEVEASLGARDRKIGITVDGSTGVKGAIQIDFAGTIIGWSIIADVAGSIQVEVDRKTSSTPPAAPGIPNTTTDKISASAPIALSSAQSAARAAAGVSTWTTHLNQWDVVQFNVISVATIARATMYLLIQEDLPSPPEISSPMEFEEEQ